MPAGRPVPRRVASAIRRCWRVRAALGAALVHSVRGGDEEGAAVLHEALALAEAAADREIECKVCRELGFVAVQAARGCRRVAGWAGPARSPSTTERAAVLGVRGKALSDRAHYDAALGLLWESVAAARRCGDVRQAAWSLAIIGRALVLRGEWEAAAEVLDHSLALVGEDGSVAFQSFPEALRAEARCVKATATARSRCSITRSRSAAASVIRVGKPWPRGAGPRHEARASAPRRLRACATRPLRAVRVADPYVWMHAHCLDALAGVAIADAAPDARTVVDQLERLAARGDMRELVVRAAVHRAGSATPAASRGPPARRGHRQSAAAHRAGHRV